MVILSFFLGGLGPLHKVFDSIGSIHVDEIVASNLWYEFENKLSPTAVFLDIFEKLLFFANDFAKL